MLLLKNVSIVCQCCMSNSFIVNDTNMCPVFLLSRVYIDTMRNVRRKLFIKLTRLYCARREMSLPLETRSSSLQEYMTSYQNYRVRVDWLIYQSLSSSSASEAMTSSNIFLLTNLLLQNASSPLSCPLMKVD